MAVAAVEFVLTCCSPVPAVLCSQLFRPNWRQSGLDALGFARQQSSIKPLGVAEHSLGSLSVPIDLSLWPSVS